MFFSRWYTSPTPLVEGAGNVSKSVAVAATCWLARVKMGYAALHDQSSWPGMLQALIHVGAGPPVRPQPLPAHR
jgi:hypothetical protein